MTSPCEVILDRLAAGESLGEDGAAHVASCVDCARLAKVPGLLAATVREPEPGPGFSSRMQIGARGRIAARRRQRIALVSVATVAVAAAAVLAYVRPNHHTELNQGAIRTAVDDEHTPQPPPAAEHPRISDADLTADLVRVSNPTRTIRGEANWNDIPRPLAAYRAVLAKGASR